MQKTRMTPGSCAAQFLRRVSWCSVSAAARDDRSRAGILAFREWSVALVSGVLSLLMVGLVGECRDMRDISS